MKELILASKSPRRKELLEKCGIPFTVEAADIDETLNPELSLREAVEDLSLRKAEEVLRHHPDAVVLGSDTIVVIHDQVLGKPADRNEAARMLELLSGNTHQVITGFAFVSNRESFSDCTVSNVTFNSLTPKEIDEYISSGEADDKAGAYGIQGLAGRFISQIEGDYYAVMGLPLSRVYSECKNLETY